MKKIIAIVLILAMSIAVAAGAGGGWYYYGRWVDTQSNYVPIEEVISTETTLIPELPINPGDVYDLGYEVTNSNPKRGYNLTNTFYAHWEVVKACEIKVTCEEPATEKKVVFEKTFTANDTMDITEIEAIYPAEKLSTSASGGSNYCDVPYNIGPNGICYITVKVAVRNDAPTTNYYGDEYFWTYMYTYRGSDEEPRGKG